VILSTKSHVAREI